MLTIEKDYRRPSSTAVRGVRRWPRALTIRRADFNRGLLIKVACVFIFIGPLLVPMLWLSGLAPFQAIAEFSWAAGRGFCSYTVKSFEIGGVPMMVCSRCAGAAAGIMTAGLLFQYTDWLKPRLPRRKLHLAVLIAALFVPWLIDSGVERLQLWNWHTDHWLMVPTGFLGGVAVVLAPLLFWPDAQQYMDEEA